MNDEHAGREPLDLVTAVSYQPGAVVSRTLLKQPGCTVTVFAFDRGQELSEHTVPHEALVQVLEGLAEITVGGVAHRVEAGRLLRMPGGCPHAVRALERFKMLLTLSRA